MFETERIVTLGTIARVPVARQLLFLRALYAHQTHTGTCALLTSAVLFIGTLNTRLRHDLPAGRL